MKKKQLFKLTFMSAMAASMIFSYGYETIPLFKSSAYVTQVEAADLRSEFKSEKLYEVMKILVNSGANDFYTKYGVGDVDITQDSRFNEFKNGPELTTTSITGYTGRVNLRPYNLSASDLSGLKRAVYVSEIDLPDAIGEIPDEIFANMAGLETVKMSQSVTKIGYNAFKECTSLNKIYIYGTTEVNGLVDLSKVSSIGNAAFQGCTSILNVKLNPNVAKLDSSAFYNCSSLGSEIVLPDNVVLGTAVFYGTRLSKITFKKGITSIPNSFLGNVKTTDGLIVDIEQGSRIKKIGNSAFEGAHIKSISIENATGLTTIENSAFENADLICGFPFNKLTNLTTIEDGGFFGTYFSYKTSEHAVQLPASLSDMGIAAFACSNVTSVNIPNKITTLNNGAFCYADELKSVTIDSGSQLKVIGDYAFALDFSLPSTQFLSGATNLKTIGDYAFAYCIQPGLDDDNHIKGLSTVIIPNGVETIGDYCFWNTASIKTVSIPDSVKKISPFAFALQDISTFPKEWDKGISFDKTEGNGSKFSILVSEGVKEFFKTDSPISELSQPMSVTLPTGITEIGESAFEYRERLKGINNTTGTVNLSNFNSLTKIGKAAFNCCGYHDAKKDTASDVDGIRNVTLPANLLSIGESAFSKCYALTNVSFSSGGALTEIGKEAFASCCPEKVETACGLQTLTNFSKLSKLQKIGEGAFKADKYLNLNSSESKFLFPESLVTIDKAAFQEVTATNAIRFNAQLTTIGDSAFAGASGLTSVDFAAAVNLKSIGQKAFEKDGKLTKVDMSQTKVEYILKGTFSECGSLVDFHAPNTLVSIASESFEKCGSLSDFYFPVTASIDSFTFGKEPVRVPQITINPGILAAGLDVPFGQKIEFEANAFLNANPPMFSRKRGENDYVNLDDDNGDYFEMAFNSKAKKFHIIGGADAKADETTVQIKSSWIFGNPGPSRNASVEFPVRVIGVQAKDVYMINTNQKEISIDVDNANKEKSTGYSWVRGGSSDNNPAKYIGYVRGSKIPTNPDKEYIVTLQADIDPSTFTYGFDSEENNLKWEVVSGGEYLEISGPATNIQPKDPNGVTKKDKYFTSNQKVRIKNKGSAELRLVYSYKEPSTGNIKYDSVKLIKVNIVNAISKFNYTLKETGKETSKIELIQGNTSSIIIDNNSIVYDDKTSSINNEPASFVFYSDNSQVATVNDQGIITAQNIYGNGYYATSNNSSCNIVVRSHSGAAIKRINVTVRKSKEETAPTSLEIVGDEYLNVGGMAKTYSVARKPELSNENVEWSISGGAATLKQVGNNATLTPVREGKVTISATSKLGNIKASKTIHIVNPTQDIRFLMKSASVEVDSSYSFGFVYDLKSQNGIYRPKDNSDFVTFTVADGSVAKLSAGKEGSYSNKICINSGNVSVKGLKEGKTVITATTESGGKTQFTFFVTKKTLKSIKITDKATVEAGKTVTLKVTKNPADSNEGYTFSSTNTAVATVDAFTGKVRGVKPGTCEIVVTSDIKKVTAKCKLTVTKNTSGYVTEDGKTFVDESGKKWKVASQVSNNQLKKNLMVADKSSSGKYKITKVVKKGGKIASGTVAYMGPYNKKCTKATVPNKVKIGGATFSVTTVANNAFKGCTKLKSMTIGTNVTSIGNMSFSGCTSLTTVTIKSTKLTKIGSKAFYGDKKLSKFTIKSSKLKSVGAGAFKNTSAKLKVKAPKAKVAAYTKLFKKGGAASTFKVTK